MAFKITKQLSKVAWPILVKQPIDGGNTAEHEFIGHFKLLKQDEYDTLAKESTSDVEFIKEFLIGWEGITDDNDKPIKFSAAKLREVAGLPFVRIAIIRAYNQAVMGAPVKN
jgi:hypothetical protein